ncbi:hypothetical protein NB502_10485 [Vibrio diabolicus]|uniref:hypothetical protein n=1 Tax=Vibrio diabolicus TaxID=50719 RepID=UPI00215BD2A3|nr:hypothetical protein [Vibrio diabolicus]MCR9472275.1 hypothetical protein [Vibrio diabolicus]
MKITNHKEWRELVTSVSVSFDIFHPLGILNAHWQLGEVYGDERSHQILRLIGLNLRDSEDITPRDVQLVRRMQSLELRNAVRRNRKKSLRVQLKSKRIRKQDDAPQAGADSSPVLQCKDEALQVSADSSACMCGMTFDLVGGTCRDCLAGV